MHPTDCAPAAQTSSVPFEAPAPTGPARHGLTVRELLTLYLRRSSAEGLHSEEARADRERTFKLFCADHGERPVSDCKPFHLTDFIDSHPSWKSVSTRRQKANEIRAAFNWATDEERIARNPFRRVKYAEAERRPNMPDDVFERIARLGNKPFERAVRFLRLTGCRLSELARAVWADVDLERGVWVLPKHKSRRFTGKAKYVGLVPDAVSLLRAIRTDQPEGYAGAIFTNNRGQPWNRRTLGQQLCRLKKKHGIDTGASLHGLRHAFASACVAAGAPIKLVSMQLGHSSVAITERFYIDLNGEMDAIRRAAALGLPKQPA